MDQHTSKGLLMLKKHLVIDMSNILHKAFYVNTMVDNGELLVSLVYHTSFMILNKYYKLYNPDKTIFVFDRPNWRFDYTQTEACISKRQYKGHRRQNMTPKQQEHYKIYKQFVLDFEQLMNDYTAIVCLSADKLEADDIIAGLCQEYHEVAETFIISADKDMIQLLQYETVRLIDPATGKDRTLEEWGGDHELFLYEKAMRGDAGDNVQSAYPRLYKTKIAAAYIDPYAHANLMEHTWVDQNSREMQVGMLFKENQLLTDLSKQPEDIRELMNTTIREGMQNRGKYNNFHFLKFLGKYNLKNVSKNLDQFIPLLSR